MGLGSTLAHGPYDSVDSMGDQGRGLAVDHMTGGVGEDVHRVQAGGGGSLPALPQLVERRAVGVAGRRR